MSLPGGLDVALSAFSLVVDVTAWPVAQRFDFMVRERPMTPADAVWNGVKEKQAPTPHQQALFFTLRGLTGAQRRDGLIAGAATRGGLCLRALSFTISKACTVRCRGASNTGPAPCSERQGAG